MSEDVGRIRSGHGSTAACATPQPKSETQHFAGLTTPTSVAEFGNGFQGSAPLSEYLPLPPKEPA